MLMVMGSRYVAWLTAKESAFFFFFHFFHIRLLVMQGRSSTCPVLLEMVCIDQLNCSLPSHGGVPLSLTAVAAAVGQKEAPPVI